MRILVRFQIMDCGSWDFDYIVFVVRPFCEICIFLFKKARFVYVAELLGLIICGTMGIVGVSP